MPKPTRKRPLNILFVEPGYEPAWALGGVVVATGSLARALASVGHCVTVYTTNSDGQGGALDVPIAESVLRDGVKVFYYAATFGTGNQFDSRQLIRSLRQSVKRFDVMYVAATYQWMGIVAPHIARENGIPSIMFTSGVFDKLHMEEKRLKKRIWYELFLKRALDQCYALHLVGPYEREQSHAYVQRWRNFLIPHCIDLEHYRPGLASRDLTRQKYNTGEATPFLLAVGRIDPLKRLDILLEALYKLKDRYDFRLVIAGNTEAKLAKDLQNLGHRLGLDSRLVWAGLVPYDEMPALYAAGDLFIHLSVDENFGLVVAEAMACGLPVLVTPGVGVWKSLNSIDVGQCVELDVNSVADALVDFFERRQTWQERGKRAARLAVQLFGPQRIANLMTQAFWDVIGGECSTDCEWYIPQGAHTNG